MPIGKYSHRLVPNLLTPGPKATLEGSALVLLRDNLIVIPSARSLRYTFCIRGEHARTSRFLRLRFTLNPAAR